MAWPVTPTVPPAVHYGDVISSSWTNSLRQSTADIWTNVQSISASSLNAVPITRQVIAGAGLTGGGDLSADRTLTLALTSALISAAGGVVTSGSYANPAWITSLAASKLTGAPPAATIAASQTPWLGDEDAAHHNLTNLNSINSGGTNLGIGTTSPANPLSVTASGVGPQVVANFNNSDAGVTTSEARIVLSEGGNFYQGIGGAYNNGSPVLTFSVSSVINSWSEVMRCTYAGQLLIGLAVATSPSSRLEVGNGRAYFSSASGSYAIGVRYVSTDGAFYFGASHSATPDGIFSNTAGTERMRITDAGNVGIGTTSPTYALDILSNAASQLRLQTGAGSGSIIYGAAGQAGAGGSIQFAATTAFANAVCLGNSLPGAATTNDFVFGTYASAGGWVERMRITSAGNVGIGTTNPAYTLDLGNGSVGGIGLRLNNAVGVGTRLTINGGNTNFTISNGYFNSNAFEIHDDTNNASRLVITPAGNVGIGTTAPAAGLDVVGTVRFGTLPSAAPAAGSKQLYYDPADGNRVKFMP
jgi:hypothetical protein